MNDEQIEQLMQELSQLSVMMSSTVELLNNVAGYLEFLAKERGFGRHAKGLPTEQANADSQYWNRLNEVRGEGGVLTVPFHEGSKPVLPSSLSDEEQAHIVATIAAREARARQQAKRNAPKRKRRRK